MGAPEWNTVAQYVGVISAGLAFISGLVIVITGMKLSEATNNAIASANERAANANERAGQLEVKAGELKLAVATAGATAATANERAARLELDAAAQRERAANAERSLLELQRRTEPRHLGATTRERLLASLKRAPQRGAIRVAHVSGDAEGSAFALQIAKILRSAGWTVSEEAGNWIGGNPLGYGLLLPSPESPPPLAVVLINAFTEVGLQLPIGVDTRESGDPLLFMVGNKQQ